MKTVSSIIARYTVRPHLCYNLAAEFRTKRTKYINQATEHLGVLGYLLHQQGDLAGARPLYEQTLAIYEQTLDTDRPFTQIARRNLDNLLAALNRSASV